MIAEQDRPYFEDKFYLQEFQHHHAKCLPECGVEKLLLLIFKWFS
jgi:hypothetical protein